MPDDAHDLTRRDFLKVAGAGALAAAAFGQTDFAGAADLDPEKKIRIAMAQARVPSNRLCRRRDC